MKQLKNELIKIVTSWQFYVITFLLANHIDTTVTMIGVYNFGVGLEGNAIIRNAILTKDASLPFIEVGEMIGIGLITYLIWNGTLFKVITVNVERILPRKMGMKEIQKEKIDNFSSNIVIVIRIFLWVVLIQYFMTGPMSWIGSGLL